ncbi:hypothetical protein HYH02_012887 [Chlamydomonas schloesseri]|uniref:Uncharacterized protein n=1 Tax=Chlamydomonas schloesseri TaxID=2026947 RepID=A0A835SZ65_9CHLO|nr:hypothetical protein HYH02_012887 [Chlamydomonas schloesseri]|eukprot:KAG2432753.1 hypothetical protein HYH02_012887 [Chlamydomonas schloesseri]
MASGLVKVTPSMTHGANGANAPAGGSLGLSGKKASNGIELMVGEVEEFVCSYRSVIRVSEGVAAQILRMIRNWMTCQCLFECSVPEVKRDTQVLVTNYRIIIRDKELKKEPGFKKCCYFASCLFCCPVESENGFEDQIFIDRREIKDVKFTVTHANTKVSCISCLCSEVNQEGFKADLYLTRTIGETRMNWRGWTLDKDVKTYSSTLPLAGFMPVADSQMLRQVLHAVACQNSNAGLAALNKDTHPEPVNLNVVLQ